MNDSQFNNHENVYSRNFHTVVPSDTIGTWVDAFNNNALASSDHTWYLGEMLCNGVLYTGRETIGGIEIQSLTNLNISSISPSLVELDNFYIYFRDINKVVLLDQMTFDLSHYNDGKPYFFYLNSSFGFRVSQQFNQASNEVMLFRFIISTSSLFTQCYTTFQRFGSNVYDTAGEYYQVKGCVPTPVSGLTLRLNEGTIKRSGIKYDYHPMPDIYEIENKPVPFNLRYITTTNEVDFTDATRTTVIPNKYLNYTTHTLSNVPNNKFTAQRILYDVYSDCLIMQYGNAVYDSMSSALSSVNNVSYPFPYDSLMFIPIGLLFIKKGATDLSDPEQAILVQQLNTTIDPMDSAFFAEDSYARGRLDAITNDITNLQQQIATLRADLSSHTTDYANPHHVTKTQVGLGNVDNYSYNTIKQNISSDLGNNWIRKNVADSTTGHLALNGGASIDATHTLDAKATYIKINNQKLYLGTKPNDAENGSWAIST